jgi:uncharacterized protein (TIGR02246 family)
MTDDQQISALFEEMCQAWTDGDAAAYGRCFTADCDYVSFDGYREQGRDGMVASHDKLFRGVLFGSALVGEVESIRHLADGVAVMHATGSVLVAWRRRLPRRRLTRNTIVAVRGPEGWRCAAIHNGRIRPVGIPSPDSVPARTARAPGLPGAAPWAPTGPGRRREPVSPTRLRDRHLHDRRRHPVDDRRSGTVMLSAGWQALTCPGCAPPGTHHDGQRTQD